MSQMIRCKHCKKYVPANFRIKNQEYCGKNECQRARKAERQKQKMANDSDYKDSQEESKKKWRLKNRDYSEKYRAKNPKYCKRNRKLQKKRDQRRRETIASMSGADCNFAEMDASAVINDVITIGSAVSGSNLAKMDALSGLNTIIPGIYRISFENPDLAKMDTSKQKYLIIPECFIDLAKMDTIDSRQIGQYSDLVQNHKNEEVDDEDRKKTSCTGSNSKN